MKREEMKELRAKPVAEIEQQIAGYRRELFDGRIKGAVEGEGLGSRAADLRHAIARCLTIINEKKRSEVHA